MNQDIMVIHLSGGEPLLHPDYFAIVDSINKKGIKVLTVSNTLLITKEYIHSYLQKGNILQITLDSMQEEEHDRTRGNGNYKKVMDIIEYCYENNLSKNIYLRHNVIRGNQKNMKEFITFALSKGINYVSMSVLRNMGRAQDNMNLIYNYKNDLQELLHINEEMAKLRKEFSGQLNINSNTFENQARCPFNRPQDFELFVRIDCLGNLYLCESFDGEDNVVGNVFENSLKNIFASKRFEKYITKLFERQEKNENCQRCLFNKACTGGCPADQYMEAHDYLHCITQCAIIRENFKNSLLEEVL